jgi:AAA ATPase domain
MVRLIKVAADTERDNGSVVFVHGLGADPITTWGGVTERRPGKLFWPAWLAEAFPEYAVYSVGYDAPPTDWHGEAQPLLNIGRSILGLLLSDEELIKRPIAFVCHSLGGLIVKQLIRFVFERRRSDAKARSLYERVGQVVFFGTPHKGSGFANAVGRFRSALRPSALTEALKINNESQLIELNEWYVGLPKNEGHHIQHLIFRETRGIGLAGFRYLVVPPDSADPGIAHAHIIDVTGADHSEICRPKQKNDRVIREMISFLADLPRAQPLPASQTSRYFEDFRNYYLKGEDGSPVPFGGRDGELAQLDAWLNAPRVAPRLLITAPAGLGKTALVMKWIEQLEHRKQVNAPGKPRLFFIAISNRFSTNAPITYLGKLARDLAYIADEPAPDTDTSEANLRGRINHLLGRLEAKGQPLLIVVDGLDEALISDGEGVETLKGLIPKPFPGNLKLLVSARWIVGDNDGRNWRNRLDWSASDQSPDITVRPLDEHQVGQVLKMMGAPLNLEIDGKDRQIGSRISKLTEGEPLLIRFYAEDLWGKAKTGSPITLETLDSVEKGFTGYFKRWIEQHQGGPVSAAIKGIDPRTVEPALAVFGFAAGPLLGHEFLDICKIGFPALPWEESSRKHVLPFQRFLIGDGVNRPYALSHPKVSYYLQGDRCKELKDRVATAFFEWGKRHIARLNSTGSDQLPPERASWRWSRTAGGKLRSISMAAARAGSHTMCRLHGMPFARAMVALAVSGLSGAAPSPCRQSKALA